MIDSLRKRKRPPRRELLDHLENIKNNYRNPTQHPEKIYDIQEAQGLFSLCIEVVNIIIKLMPTRSNHSLKVPVK